jgi:hypothetical protein
VADTGAYGVGRAGARGVYLPGQSAESVGSGSAHYHSLLSSERYRSFGPSSTVGATRPPLHTYCRVRCASISKPQVLLLCCAACSVSSLHQVLTW